MENEKKELVFQEAGKYCLDLSKLIFGGIVLAGIMKLDVNSYVLFVLGTIVVVITALLGFKLISISKK